MTLTLIALTLLGTAPTALPAQETNPRVTISVANRGDLVIELFPREAPRTVTRFLGLTRDRFYDGVRFHRVERYPRPFIIVTGDPLTKDRAIPINDPKVGFGKTGINLPFEANDLKFTNGTLGLVRDERDKNSGDCMFFICEGDRRFLEGSYTAFGRVVVGLPLIPKIQLGDTITSVRETK